MENNYESISANDALKSDKEASNFFKPDELPIIQEKNVSFELPNCVKPIEVQKQSENMTKNSIDKQKVRQYLSCRSEVQHVLDIKSPKIKKTYENTLSFNSKVPFLPLLSIRTNAIDENYKEIKDLKMIITELEEKNKVNSQCVEINKVRINDLEERFLKLKQKAGIGCSHAERKEELVQKLKNLHTLF